MPTTIRGVDNFDTAPEGLGKVLQVAHTTLLTDISISAGVDTILTTLDFTPKRSDSVILVSVCYTNLRKSTGAGTSSWFTSKVTMDGNVIAECPVIGYPETYNDHRFNLTHSEYTSSWVGTKTLELHGLSASVGSTWIVSYQGTGKTVFTIMEIAQ